MENISRNVSTNTRQSCTVKNVRLKQRTEQWFTGDILRSVSVRDKAWKQYRKQTTSDNFTEYKRLRNMADALIKKAKKDFVKIKDANPIRFAHQEDTQ